MAPLGLSLSLKILHLFRVSADRCAHRADLIGEPILHVFVICLHVLDFSLLLRLELLKNPFPTGLILTA